MDVNSTPQENPEDFGMTEEEVKNYKMKSVWQRIKYYGSLIAPTLISMLNTTIYWSLKLIKAFVGGMIRMVIKGG